jgi:hypothetical protein
VSVWVSVSGEKEREPVESRSLTGSMPNETSYQNASPRVRRVQVAPRRDVGVLVGIVFVRALALKNATLDAVTRFVAFYMVKQGMGQREDKLVECWFV